MSEREIQVESDDFAVPERVLCMGPIARRFEELSVAELELVRRAAQARSGILWLDSRDGQLWWVNQEKRDESNWHLTYSNPRWIESAGAHATPPVTLLESTEHQRLLDHARRRDA